MLWLAVGALALLTAGATAVWQAHRPPTRHAAKALPPTRYESELAALISSVALRSGLHLSVKAALVPRSGAATTPTALAAYRRAVTGAALAVGLSDQAAVDAWRAAGPSGQAGLIQSWAGLLRGLLPAAQVEIAVVGGAGVVARGTLAVGAPDVTVHLPAS